MPNWCEGNIRFRGKRENIINLLLNELEFCGNEKAKVIYNDEDSEIYTEDIKNSLDDWYINGTNRCFVNGFHTYLDEETEKDINVCIDGFRAAWSIKDQGFRELAQKYDVDIRCVGFENGCLFYQIITFYRDGYKKEEYKEFKDCNEWGWNALFPNLGG